MATRRTWKTLFIASSITLVLVACPDLNKEKIFVADPDHLNSDGSRGAMVRSQDHESIPFSQIKGWIATDPETFKNLLQACQKPG